jgi:hypothetical protein
VKKPRKGWQTRRSQANLFVSKTLWSNSGSSVRGRCEARERIGSWGASDGEGEPPREDEPHEGLGPSVGLNRRRRVRALAGIEALKWRSGSVVVLRPTPPSSRHTVPRRLACSGGAKHACCWLNHRRAGTSERAARSAGGIDPEGENPKGGTGMKQGRQAVGGAKPREREKR